MGDTLRDRIAQALRTVAFDHGHDDQVAVSSGTAADAVMAVVDVEIKRLTAERDEAREVVDAHRCTIQQQYRDHTAEMVKLREELWAAQDRAAAAQARLGDMTTRLERILGPARYPLAEVAAEFGVDLDGYRDQYEPRQWRTAADGEPPAEVTRVRGSNGVEFTRSWAKSWRAQPPAGDGRDYPWSRLVSETEGPVPLTEVPPNIPAGSATQDGDAQ